jgi:hypothetical protein
VVQSQPGQIVHQTLPGTCSTQKRAAAVAHMIDDLLSKPEALSSPHYHQNKNVNVFFFLRQGLICGPGWPQTHYPPASGSQVLGLQICTTMPTFKCILIYDFFLQRFFFEPGVSHMLGKHIATN